MGDLFSNLGLGFGVVFQFVQWTPAFLGGTSIPIPVNILLCLIGALVGTLVFSAGLGLPLRLFGPWLAF